MDGLKEQGKLTKKEKELIEKSEKAVPVVVRTVKAWHEKTKASVVAAYSLALSYTQLEYNWLPKAYKNQILKAFSD